jgi:hypothetical protein
MHKKLAIFRHRKLFLIIGSVLLCCELTPLQWFDIGVHRLLLLQLYGHH